MRALVLSWEYPPITWGGLSYHVYRLSEELKKEDIEVHILTQGREDSTERKEQLYIHRVTPETVDSPDFLTKTMALNFQLLKKGIPLVKERGPFHLLHLHDWLVIHAGSVLKHAFQLPLLLTIHATEHGRNHGIHNSLQRYINDLEWFATYEAWKVICCSSYMAEELKCLFSLPSDKIAVIENGISLEDVEVKAPSPSFRSKYAKPNEKILFFVGRLVQEKGVQDLFQGVKILKEKGIGVKAIIAGRGPFKEELESFACSLAIEEEVLFTGFIDDSLRNNLYAIADAAVFPSLYEPFGIVALEAMAAKTPVVVTSVGGLDEIVRDRENGLKVRPGDPYGLSKALEALFKEEDLKREMIRTAREEIEETYSWSKIGRKTRDLYQDIVEESRETPWVTNKGRSLDVTNSWKTKDYRYQKKEAIKERV